MPRPRNDKPWLHTRSGYWCATVNGERKYLDKNLKVACRRLKALRAQAKREAAGGREWLDATFAELTDEFLSDRKGHWAAGTYDTNRGRLLLALRILGAQLRVVEFRKFHLAKIESCTPWILPKSSRSNAFEAAAMALSLSSCPATGLVQADIVELDANRQIADWSRVCTDAFGFDDAFASWWPELFTSIPFGGAAPVRHFIARIDGEPVGTASSFVEDGVVGLARVEVPEGYRRRGIGSAWTVAALETARNLGCELGVLFSSPMATPMYEAMGLRRYGTGRCYSWSPHNHEEKTRSWA